jgi:hypothetical protein
MADEDKQKIEAPEGVVIDDFSKPDATPPGITLDQAAPGSAPLLTPSSQAPPPTPTWAQHLGVVNPWGTAALDAAQAATSGAMSTIYQGGDLIRRAMGLPQVINQPELQAALKPPPSLAGTLGRAGEQVAEFFAPSELVSGTEKAIEAARFLPRAVRYALKLAPEAAAAAGVSAVQTGGDPKAAALAAILAGGSKVVLPLAGAIGAKVLGGTTGAGTKAVEKAAEGSADFVNAMRGNTNEFDILNHLNQAAEGVKAERGAVYQRQLAQLPSMQLDIRPLQSELSNALRAHNINASLGSNGQPLLDFSRSTISDPTAQNQVLGIYNDIRDWGNQSGDLTPFGVDVLKRRIDDLYSESSNARAFVQRLKNQARGLLNDQVPGYQQMTADYAQASDFLDNLKDLSLGAKNDGTAIRKFSTLMNQNNQFRQGLVDQLSKYAGRDLQAEIAGHAMRSAMPGKIGFGLDALLGGYAWSHPGMWPGAIGTAAATSPRLVGETARLAGKAAPYIPKAAAAIPSVIHVNPNLQWNEQQNLPQFQPPYAQGGLVDPLKRLPDRKAVLRSLIR